MFDNFTLYCIVRVTPRKEHVKNFTINPVRGFSFPGEDTNSHNVHRGFGIEGHIVSMTPVLYGQPF